MKNISNKIINLAIGSSLALASVGALAEPSNSAELRGYGKCVDAAAEQSEGLATQRFYLLNTQGDQNQYYINASRWEEGDRVAVRIACETSANGRVLLSQSVAAGRFEGQRGRVSVEVAKR
ncbi:MAG: hypothetical protein AB8B93_15855 [Pseudomonadales bacterium]